MISLLVLAALQSSLCPSEKATVRRAAAAIDKHYVLPEKASSIAAHLRKWAQSAPRGKCATPKQFAHMFTQTLRSVSGDGHFVLESASSPADSNWIDEWYAMGPKVGFGISRVEILDANIGLLKITSFYDLEQAYSRLNAAFTLLADTDALILDLRGNGGGSSQTAWPIQWTFLQKGAPLPIVVESRSNQQQREEPAILWQRYGTKRPVVVLIDKRSFSASEAVAYSLQTAKRASVIGQRSGGGAHILGDPIGLPGGYNLFIPTQRPKNPLNGENWEGHGVRPDILTTSENALPVAMSHVKKQIRQHSLSPSKKP